MSTINENNQMLGDHFSQQVTLGQICRGIEATPDRLCMGIGVTPDRLCRGIGATPDQLCRGMRGYTGSPM